MMSKKGAVLLICLGLVLFRPTAAADAQGESFEADRISERRITDDGAGVGLLKRKAMMKRSTFRCWDCSERCQSKKCKQQPGRVVNAPQCVCV